MLWPVPWHVHIGRERERRQLLPGRPPLQPVQQLLPEPLPRPVGVHAHLLQVGAAVDHVGEQVGDRAVVLVGPDPGADLPLVGRQDADGLRVVLGHQVHAERREERPGGALDRLQHREIGRPRRSDAACRPGHATVDTTIGSMPSSAGSSKPHTWA